MDHGSDRNFVLLDSVDHSIAIDDQFADTLVIEFWDFSSGLGKLGENPDLVQDFLNDIARMSRGVGCNILSDPLQIVESSR